jgi:glutathione S-transferase
MTITSTPVLYSFRRCPYAMRARMALYSSGIVCELREVVLRNKPETMLALSPKGTVPVLLTCEGKVIDESLDIMLWALRQNDPEDWLSPQHGSLEGMLALIERNDFEFKDHLDRYKYPVRYEGVDTVQERTKGELFLQDLEQHLSKNSCLFGAKLSLADFAIAPFVRQFANVDKSWFDQTPYTGVQDWLNAFLCDEHFTVVMDKYAPWKEGDSPVFIPNCT